MKNTRLLEKIIPHTNREVRDFLLATTDYNDHQSMRILFEAGARFKVRHYRFDTYEKINHWIEKLLNEGDDS